MKRIEFGELRIGKKARNNLLEVCDNNWASAGPMVKEFELEFSRLMSYKRTVAVSSGTDADINAYMTLYDLGAQPGDEIIVPALSFIATANAVRAAGFTPVFVDVRKETLNLDETKVESAITLKTRAIVAVTTMGKPCEMFVLRKICDKHNLLLICDNAEGHGSQINAHFMGSIADLSTYSFYVAHLVCCGEGGAVCTNREDLYESLISTRSHGREGNSLYFNHVRYGLNSKMNDLEASIGLEGLSNFWETFWNRKKNYYTILEAVLKYRDVCFFSEEEKNCENCPHGFSFTLREPNKEKFRKFTSVFDKYNIHWKRNFGCIPTQHECFKYLGYNKGAFPNAEHIGDYGIHIGVHQYLSQEDLNRIVKCSVEALKTL